ncbi:MAG TPA: hypothetical protein VM470_07125 [Acidimicrobiia bacterium]|nr:hypothetical protein [Acidimicrobiia bacterium]
MVKVYAIVLSLGILVLLIWIFARSLAVNVSSWAGIDPEGRLGLGGRRVVAGSVGFGLGGMSAEFSPRDLSWQVALVLALVAGAAAAWYAGWVDRADGG